MAFRRKKSRKRKSLEAEGFTEAATDRLRSIGESGGYSYDPDEREDVEARLRNMWYGTPKSGESDEGEGDELDPTYASGP